MITIRYNQEQIHWLFYYTELYFGQNKKKQ
jgi:hypothetical protein